MKLNTPEITIHYPDGNFDTVTYGGGGNHGSETIQGRLRLIDLPDNLGIRIRPLPNADLPFLKITTTPGVIPTTGSIMQGGDLHYIPDDPGARREKLSTTHHTLHKTEMLTILFTDGIHLLKEPSANDRANMIQILEQTTHIADINTNDRAIRFLELFDDRQAPENAPNGLQQDYGWLLRHWEKTMGGESRRGWFEGVCPRGAGGQTNWHYETLLWLVVNYLRSPRADLWYLIVEQTMRHCDFGRVLDGRDRGLPEYEKGDAYHGQNFRENIAKSWSRGPMVVNALMGGHPVIQHALDEMNGWLKRSNPKLVWQGYWGARVGARYLDELLLFWVTDKAGNADLRTKAVQHARAAKGWLDPTYGVWINKPSPHNTSPWMNSQFAQKLFQWEEQSPGFLSDAGWSIDELLDVCANIMHHGITRDVGGKPMFLYRMIHQPIAPRSMHITSFARPMLMYMNAHNPARFGSMWTEMDTFLREYQGSGNADIASGVPRALDPLDFRFAPEGPGWGDKVLQFYLNAWL